MMNATETRTLRRQKVVVCGRCGGSGVVEEIIHLDHGRTADQKEQCKLCRGGGMLTICKRVSIEIFPKRAEELEP